jgi:hypothetical protein
MRTERTIIRILVAGLAVLGLAGCTTTVGTLPRVTLLAPTDGFKMLKPKESATRCRAEWPTVGADGDLIDSAVRALLARDDEGDALLDVVVESTAWSVGVYGRRCVTVTGDVVRSVRSVLLPMPESHRGHHHE